MSVGPVTKVTLKFGGGYEAPWISVEGTPEEVRDQILDAFEFGESVSGASLAEIIAYAGLRAQGAYTLVRDLGIDSTAPAIEAKPEAAKPAKRKPAAKKAAPKKQAEPEGELEAVPMTAAEPAKSEPPFDPDPAPAHPIIAQMDKVSTMDEFKKLWAANQAAFKDEAVIEHAKRTQARLKGAA